MIEQQTVQNPFRLHVLLPRTTKFAALFPQASMLKYIGYRNNTVYCDKHTGANNVDWDQYHEVLTQEASTVIRYRHWKIVIY